MAICLVVDNPGQSQQQAEQVMKALRATGPLPPTGASQVLGGAADGGWRVVSIWDSADAIERFVSTRLEQAYREAGVDAEQLSRSTFEIYMHRTREEAGAGAPVG